MRELILRRNLRNAAAIEKHTAWTNVRGRFIWAAAFKHDMGTGVAVMDVMNSESEDAQQRHHVKTREAQICETLYGQGGPILLMAWYFGRYN